MFVLDVIPLTPAAPPGSLSYRSSKKLAPGRIVSVTLRRKRVPAVVVDCLPLQEAKMRVKSASFMLAGDVMPEEGGIPEAIMEAVERVAVWHAAGRGAVLSALLLELIKSDEGLSFTELVPGSGFALQPIELPLRTRANKYRELIKGALGLEQAALLVVPTLAEVEFWKKELGEFTPLVISGAVSGARRRAMLKRAENSRSLIIATPSFAWIPVEQLGTVIVERVSAGGYRLPKRPYLDTRIALIELCRARQVPCVIGDFPLPLEYRAGLRKLAAPEQAIEIIDARRDTELPALEDEPWSAVPKKMLERIRAAHEAGERSAVLAVRKGYAGAVICRDCGQALRDDRGSAYAFSLTPSGERQFRTSDGKSVLAADIACPRCGSWNLLPLGVGVERVYEELKAAFPQAEISLFDADKIRTVTGAKKALGMLEAPGAIIIGTEAMIPWLLALVREPLALACVASADSLLALPFWRARERFLRLGYLLPECAQETLVATRLMDDTAVQQLIDPRSEVFFAEETTLRKTLGYPPFGTLIALQLEGGQEALTVLEGQVRAAVGSVTVRQVPDRFLTARTIRRILVLSLPKDAWPDPELSQRLAALPPSVRVMVDPESFW